MIKLQATKAPSPQKKPCDPCKEKVGSSFIPKAFFQVRSATEFASQMTHLVNDTGYAIASGSLDPVVALLVFRRRIGFVAEQFESCKICRQDIVMAEEFDQYMIDAKQVRLSWIGKHRWEALKMYGKFQVNIIRGIFKWVPEIRWLILFASLGVTALILRIWGLL